MLTRRKNSLSVPSIGNHNSKRLRGRPEKRWRDCIEEDVKRAAACVEVWQKQQEDKERHWVTF